jgi:hypothetical protein
MIQLECFKNIVTDLSVGAGSESSGKVRSFWTVVTALTVLMASATFFEFHSLNISKMTMASSKLQVKRTNIVRPLTTNDLWIATWKVRRQLADVGEKMEKNSTFLEPPPPSVWDSIYRNLTLDISPIYDIVDVAIDTVGVKGLYFKVFYDGKLLQMAGNRDRKE